jgi:hypothetical protein
MYSAHTANAPSDAEVSLLLAGAEPVRMRSWRMAASVHMRTARGMASAAACVWGYDAVRVVFALRAIR